MFRKYLTLSALLLMTVFSLQVQGQKIVRDKLTGNPMLRGQINAGALAEPPFSEWYDPGYSQYTPDTNTIIRLINNQAPEYKYTIVLGTWCPDSRREVPRMMKVLNEAGVPASRITLYAVNRKMKAPRTPVRSLHIKAVPTLIVSREGEEYGRIIESPETTVEEDLLKIISGN